MRFHTSVKVLALALSSVSHNQTYRHLIIAKVSVNFGLGLPLELGVQGHVRKEHLQTAGGLWNNGLF